MKKILFPILILILSISVCELNAQSLRRVIQKTVVDPSRKANDIAQDKAEEEAERQATKAIMEGFGITENAKFDDEYKFDAWFRMQITSFKKNGKVDDQVVYDSYVNKAGKDYGMEYLDDDSRATILFDADRFAMIILSNDDGEKTGFATKFDPSVLEEDIDDESEASDLEPFKTGKTKKILGYSCDEYLIDGEDYEVHMWISEKLGKEISKEMLNNPNAFGGAFQYSRTVEGMILEYDLIDKDNGEKSEMLVTDLDLKKNHSISTAGYNIISMNLGQE